MSWDYYGFRPYVSVAQRRREAQREMEKRRKKGLNVSPITIKGRVIAQTFWGQAWCDNLESYSDFANRLPRGRTYVRNGSVVHLEIDRGKISALVSGSELYSVEITISSLPDTHWKCVKKECAGQISSLVELLQGRLSRSVMDVVTQRGAGLFPKPAEIKMRCSCPDWAGMCKHVAAVMYGVGARLDDQPELLFLLRKVDHLELIAGAVGSAPAARASKARGKKTIATADLADVFGIEMAGAELAAPAPTASTTQPAKPALAAPEAVAQRKPSRARAGQKKEALPAAATRNTKKAGAAKSKPAAAARVKPAARKQTVQETC
jgi:uncharacterized Zn finger protein